jgi:subtilisin family serine protease
VARFNGAIGLQLALLAQFPYTLTGRGVDVVIQDSGLSVNHPEYTDANGVSRVVELDWYAASGLAGTQDANHYRDYHGHGSHCAGTVAGRTQGWAKDAAIYRCKS